MAQPSPRERLAPLVLGAIGVVYGDIGTSPLYALQQAFNPEFGVKVDPQNILGVVSLTTWMLAIIVALKYVGLILRADNNHEGGVMALIALAASSVGERVKLQRFAVFIGLCGAALFFGDGVITPAVSVLSAVEGIEIATPTFKPYILPLAVAILTALYIGQKHGTGRIGVLFGPVLAIWFVVIALLGLAQIMRAPQILNALNPLHGLTFMWRNGWIAFVALGAIVLTVTGAEALYADLGHFGKRAIRTAWFALVFPALLLEYLGQGALLLTNPAAVDNPFYRQVPDWGVIPLVVLATAATVIASQATISGTFSLVRQAIQLGFMPRMHIVQTSASSFGQIYVPAVNWLQFILVVAVVIGFGSSAALASAYGIAVTGTMFITTLLTFFVVRYGWKYPLWISIVSTGFFAAIDFVLYAANNLKILQGGWFPLAVALVVFTVMTTWKRGRTILLAKLRAEAVPLEVILESLMRSPPTRVPGTAVFLRAENEGAPRALMHNLLHNKVLHERVIFLTVHVASVPWIPADQRVTVTPLGHHCFQIDVHYGFKNEPDLMRALEFARSHGLAIDPMETSFFLSRQKVVPVASSKAMAHWRERLFAAMTRNAADSADYFRLPLNRVAELGSQIEI
ncbi:MAG TPA: potassium transporter Kup [Burkholderiaceae bacterium]|nr:potassium transporter Kup [Burkholderiaceae bacterium]